MRFARLRKRDLLIEPASSASGDIAFNLIVFFLVCASIAPDSGRKQELPSSEKNAEQKAQLDNVEVALTRTAVTVNGNVVAEAKFLPLIKEKLKTKRRPQDRIVIVRSSKDTPYEQWIKYTGLINDAGGIITLQIEEEQVVVVN